MKVKAGFFVFILTISFSLRLDAQAYIQEISFFDQGSLSANADLGIDIERGSCGFVDKNGDGDTLDPEDIDPEPFYDSLVTLKVKNSNSIPIKISKIYYRLPNANGKLKNWMGGLAPVSSGFIAAKSESNLSFFLFKVKNNSKFSFRPNIELKSSLSFQDIILRLDGRLGSGRLLRITAKRALSFGNENRCTN